MSTNIYNKNWLLAIAFCSSSSMAEVRILVYFVLLSCATAAQIIHEVCKASRDPPSCEASLSSSQPTNDTTTVSGAILSALRISSRNRDAARGMVQQIIDSSPENSNRSRAAKLCLEGLLYSEYRTNLTVEALSSPGGIKDARAWMSAALGHHHGCWSGLRYVNDSAPVNETMSFFSGELIASTADALAMLANYDVFGETTEWWCPPKTERDGFWPAVPAPAASGFVGGVPAGLKPDLTVCKGGGCDFETVQEAVNASPEYLPAGKTFVIWIKAGVYEETLRVPLEKKNVVFLGDGMGRTVITGSTSVGLSGLTTYDTATVGVVGDGFMATGVTIQNTAGAGVHQAVAFRSDSDLSVIDNCEFIGNQDTLYAHSLRQYYKSCRIQGNVDFIFGNAAGFFQDCLILVSPRQINPEAGETNSVTAQGRIHPSQTTGFVFRNCEINGTDSYMSLFRGNPGVHRTFLGRPWKEYSRTVFINCSLEALIGGEGWMPWSGDFGLKTLYYGEFGNGGPGSDTSERVPWSSLIPAEDVDTYAVENFIQGDLWIPTLN